MKFNLLKYLAAASALLTGAAGLTGCQDHFDEVTPDTPVATIEPNISILDFKQEFWTDENNYCVEIPAREDGSHYIVSGRVISSDYSGNIFRSVYIQDETAALPMSIYQYNLYLTNRVGQEVVIDLTGMYVGKYNGMLQLGFPDWYEQGQCYETSFMAPELYNAHVQYNGNPDPAKVDTITVNDLSELSDLAKWQGQLVRFNNAKFAKGGTGAMLCDSYHSKVSAEQNKDLNISGGSIIVRTSGYAKFWNTKLPAEACDVVGILGYYGTTGWQLYLNDAQGLMNIGNATQTGTKEKPYSVSEAIEFAAAGTTSGWVKGYIVGTVAPERTEVNSNDDISWAPEEGKPNPVYMPETLVIAAEPTVRDYKECIIIPLTEGSTLYNIANLADNPEQLGKTLSVQGRINTYMGMAAVTGNSGSETSFELEGYEADVPTDGDGTEAAPYTVSQLISLGNPGTTGQWVTGYIVGVMNFVEGTGNVFSDTELTTNSNIVIAASTEGYGNNIVAIQLPAGAMRTALNLVNHPENKGKLVSVCGDLIKYCGVTGVKNTTTYKMDGAGGDTPTPPDGGTEEQPYTVDQLISMGNPGTTGQWVEGTIVGVMNWNDAAKANEFSATNLATNSNIVIAASGENYGNNIVAIQLPAGAVRTALNLVDHPENLGKTVKVCGDLLLYCGVTGVKNTSAYEIVGGGDTPTPPTPPAGGTEEQPYTVDQVLGLSNPSGTAWIEGYIVGSSTNGIFNPILTADGANAANIILAENAGETDPAKMVPVQLPSGSDVRAMLNLKDNPGNLGKKVKLEGTLSNDYFSRNSLRTPTKATIL